MTFRSTKTYGHDLGISCAFRQWRANSHCKYIHGYALAFKFTFEAESLDSMNWVVDFGGLKSLKEKLTHYFDHKLIVAGDDPELELFTKMDEVGIAQVIIFPDGVGCEKLAEQVYHMAEFWMETMGYSPRCKLVSVEVMEHGANSAIYSK